MDLSLASFYADDGSLTVKEVASLGVSILPVAEAKLAEAKPPVILLLRV